MKTSYLLRTAFFTCLFTSLISCEKDEISNEDLYQDPTEGTVSDYIKSQENLTSLFDALTYTDLIGELETNTEFQTLLPTNEAFQVFLSENNYNSIEDVPSNYLRQILQNHFIDNSIQLKNGNNSNSSLINTRATQLFDPTVNIVAVLNRGNDLSTINGVNIPNETMSFRNGNAMVVNSMVMPSTIQSVLESQDDFRTLLEIVSVSTDTEELINVFTARVSESDDLPRTLLVPSQRILETQLNLVFDERKTDYSAIQSAFMHMHISTKGSFHAENLTHDQEILMNTTSAMTNVAADGTVSLSVYSGVLNRTTKLNNGQTNDIIPTGNGTIQRVERSLF